MINKVFLLVLLSEAVVMEMAAANVVKCKLASGKTIYQATPCPANTVSKKTVEIKKQTTRQIEEAQNKLKAWQARQVAEEEAKLKADKELREQLDRQETIKALDRNTFARQQQAISAQRQAEALDRQRDRYPRLYAVPPQH